MFPVDPAALGCVLMAAAASLGAVLAARREHWSWAVALAVLAAAALHGNLVWHHWLSPWDERAHALVARNLLDHPLLPTLVEWPLEDAPPEKWLHTRIWLHKPPFALWLMAGAMSLLGVGEVALRVPSWLLGSLSPALTWGVARRFLDRPSALAAALFHVWHGRSGEVIGGLRTTDHVDAVFWPLAWGGVLAALVAADAAGAGQRRRTVVATAATGGLLGLAFLTKDAPALVIAGVFGLRLLQTTPAWGARLGLPLASLALAALPVAAWRLYTASAFPEAAAAAAARAWLRWRMPVEGHGGPWWYHLDRVPTDFGWGTALALAAFGGVALWRRRDWLPLVGWWVAVYGAFAAAATKLEGYVFLAAPVAFCACGWLVVSGWRAAASLRARPGPRAAALAAAAFLVVATYAPQALESQRITNPRPRRMVWAEELRHLAREVEGLPPGRWVVLNVATPVEAMFYGRFTAEGGRPLRKDLRNAEARGLRVAVYGDPGDPELAWLRERGIPFLTPDPRVDEERRLAALLASLGEGRVAVFGARDPTQLEAYLDQRQLRVDVSPTLPAADDRFTRKALRRGARGVLLVGRRPPPRAALEAFPGLQLFEAPGLALEPPGGAR